MLQLERLFSSGREGKRAVIVSVGEFYPRVNLQRRPGATRDVKKLHKTLSKMGFKVDIHIDLRSDEIYDLFLKGREPDICYKHCNIFLNLILKKLSYMNLNLPMKTLTLTRFINLYD